MVWIVASSIFTDLYSYAEYKYNSVGIKRYDLRGNSNRDRAFGLTGAT